MGEGGGGHDAMDAWRRDVATSWRMAFCLGKAGVAKLQMKEVTRGPMRRGRRRPEGEPEERQCGAGECHCVARCTMGWSGAP